MNKKSIILTLAILCGSTACSLDREPEGVLSTTRPFSSVGEIENYINRFYETGLITQGFNAGGGNHIAGSDTHSDNMASSAVNARLDGKFALSQAPALGAYWQIREINFLLANLGNVPDINSAEYKHLIGEAHYFRAWYYYRLFVNFGQLTWLDKPLPPKQEEMLRKRDSRLTIADKILADLDVAIENLQERNSSATMRLHKDVARALKSEVALFEATWEKYHKAENDGFFDPNVTDEKIKDYLNQAVKAAKEVIDRNVWQIYTTGNPQNDYRELFATADLSSNSEVLWFKRYDGDQIGNNVNRYLNQGGGGIGVTASLVDDYLTIEGKPFIGEAKISAKRTYGDELKPTLRDPRLAQTVCTPGQSLRRDMAPYALPPLKASSYHQNVTGYSLLKHVQIDYMGNLDAEFKGATPAIQFRYADILLNYAEALAEMGGAEHASQIVEAIRPLRQRVGMPDMDFDREFNSDADYPFRHLDKYIQAVRRERRIEQACEGKRQQDIFRWAAADELIVGKRPHGALFTGSNLATSDQYKTLVYDKASGNNFYLSGTSGDELRYILPNPKNGYENGWQFNPKRDYLLPINQNMIARTQGNWVQNPGW